MRPFVAQAGEDDHVLLAHLLRRGHAAAPTPPPAPSWVGESEPAVVDASAEAIRRMLWRGDSEKATFVDSLTDAEWLAREIAAFANASGGLILVGARPPDILLGCDTRQVEQVYHATRPLLSPEPASSFHTIVIEGKALAGIRVARAHALTMAKGGAFLRRGARIEAMSAADITRLAARPVQKLVQERGNTAAKSAALSQDVEPVMRAMVTPLARAIVQQSQMIEQLHADLANAASLESRAKEWLFSAIIGALVGQLVATIFG